MHHTPVTTEAPTHLLQHTLYGFTSFWWVVEGIRNNLPPWSLVPPILIGIASVINAINAWRKESSARRAMKQQRR
jgi:hypothetical protein